MKIELIQPFINAADAVLSETLQGPARMSDVSMEKQMYRRTGLAAIVRIQGEIEGRVVFDVQPAAAVTIASSLAGEELSESEDLVRETVLELANLVIGNAVTTLNDQGFRFKVRPPEIHVAEEGARGSEDTEALVMCRETAKGNVVLNIAMRYNRRRRHEHALAAK
jgi:chemotaxis protein CheX